MASDASRRWLDGSGIWSCRIKLPQQPIAAEQHSLVSLPVAPNSAMDVTLDNGSPGSRRNKGKIAEAIQSMSNLNASLEALDLPTDPDAQATVTDFLDFTEYLPADMIRSLTLIRNLDQTYTGASGSVHELTKRYGDLPNLSPDEKPDAVKLRAEISENLEQAVSARTLAHAEASRMAENVDRHYNRAKNILAKLQKMAENYPPSREPSPIPQNATSPTTTTKSKFALRVDSCSGNQGPVRVRKPRAPRITVPGEVLAPYELDYESYGSETDASDPEMDEPTTPRGITPGGSIGAVPKIVLKVSKKRKERSNSQKPPRQPRPPGVMGTNAHSAVAGISTSNALAKLNPPPTGAVKGDENLPWLQLNAWELAHLRKRMKKNAIWSPSDTMISRELKQLGRGIEAYRALKADAEAAGIPFEQPEPPQLRGETVNAEGAMSVEAIRSSEIQLSNRGMKLNEAKKLKREHNKDLAKQAAEEAEESARKMAQAAEAMKDLFKNEEKISVVKTPSKSKTPARKRKRESPEHESEKLTEGDAAVKATRSPLKRTKTETPVPIPPPTTTKPSPTVLSEAAASITSEAAPLPTPIEPSIEPLAVPLLPVLSPMKSSTPILPPTREPKRPIPKETKKVTETASNTRPRRTSASGATTAPPVHVPEPLTLQRPTSSRSKAASVEPGPLTGSSTIDRPLRASTARSTPVPESRQQSKRSKRPAPGVVTTGSEGSATVSVGKRKAATRKKAGTRKEKKDGREGSTVQETFDEVDDEGNVIDPDEPRYCLCNRVSFGTMIGCENENCEKEWFHLECVGLTDIPPRTTKWYCPDCRVTLKIGQKGEVTARGRKK
ncbi:PHD-finger domain-containing protein [Diplocarpon rosae]|nr:PHD-finger domain-containing protein [Diplocarpon rosae]